MSLKLFQDDREVSWQYLVSIIKIYKDTEKEKEELDDIILDEMDGIEYR